MIDALKVVFRALASNVDAVEEVEKIMAGKILEFPADKYYEAGKLDGMEAGMEAGKKIGMEAGMEKLQKIIHDLDLEEDPATIIRLISDKNFREEMYGKCKDYVS